MTDEPGRSIRVLIADDHAVVREGLRGFLNLQDGITVVGEAADGSQVLELEQQLSPDVILMDLVMPGLDGVGAMRALRDRGTASKVVVLTSFMDDERLTPALQAGASGYLLKNVQPRELARAIRKAHEGEAVIDPVVAARLLQALSESRLLPADRDDAGLSAREREVLTLIAGGLPNKRIARELGISEKTVKVHVGRILGKLDVTDRTQAALAAMRRGLVPGDGSGLRPRTNSE